jgi:hypothetical protein
MLAKPCPKMNSMRAPTGWKRRELSQEGYLRVECHPIWRRCGESAI